jgi:hypothetical protein
VLFRSPAEWAIALMRRLQFHHHVVVASWHKERCRADMIQVLHGLVGRPSKTPLLILEPEEDKSDPRFWLLNAIHKCIAHFNKNPEFVIVENCFMDSKLGDKKISSPATNEIGMLPYMGALQQFNILQVFNRL